MFVTPVKGAWRQKLPAMALADQFSNVPPSGACSGPVMPQVHAACAAALKPGGTLVLCAFSKAQLGRKSGGPPRLEWLHDVAVRRDRATRIGLISGTIGSCNRVFGCPATVADRRPREAARGIPTMRRALTSTRSIFLLLAAAIWGMPAAAQTCATYGVDDVLLAELSWAEELSEDIVVQDGMVFTSVFHVGGTEPGDYPYGAYRIHDLTDPESPVLYGYLPWPSGGGKLGVHGSYIYTAFGTADWTTGVEVGTFSLSGYACTDVLTVGGSLWVVHTGGVDVFDLADPADPALAATLQNGEICRAAVQGGDLVHVLTSAGLTVWDVADPLAPVQRGFLGLGGTPRAAATAGDIVVVTTGSLLQSIDVTDPDLPVLAAAVTPPLQIKGLAARGELVYATNNLGWLEAWDLSVPSAPVRSGYVMTAGAFGGFGLLDTAVIAMREGGMRTFRRECMDPGAPGASPVGIPSAGVPLAVAPNPFNPAATIHFTVGAAGLVSVDVHDARGAHVATLYSDITQPGTYRVGWDGRDDSGRRVASGTYLVRKRGGGPAEAARVTLLK